MNGRSTPVAGPSAFQAPGPLMEDVLSGVVLRQTRFGQQGRGRPDGPLAVFAYHPDQALGQDAVQGGDEVVGLHPHVHESTQHVHHVVGMHRGEDQVAGESRLDGDLGRLRIPDLTHHDLVGIVPQNGAQSAGKGQPLLLVHRNLGDPLELVFDGILDGNDLVFFGLDLRNRGIQGGRLAAAGGTGDQHHPVRLADVSAKFSQVGLVESHHIQAELAELLAHRLLVQHPQHRILAMDGRHDGDPKVDAAALVTDPEAPVLRNAPFGDIELGHDLDPGDDGGVMLLGNGRHGLLENAVDPVLDVDVVVFGMDVDVAGPALQGVEDGGVHQPDDGALRLIGQFLNGDLLAGLVLLDQGQALGGFLQHPLGRLALLEYVADLGGPGHPHHQSLPQQRAQLILQHQLAGVGNGHHQGAIDHLERDEVVAEHPLRGDVAEEFRIHGEVRQVDEFTPVPLSQVTSLLLFFAGARVPVHRRRVLHRLILGIHAVSPFRPPGGTTG